MVDQQQGTKGLRRKRTEDAKSPMEAQTLRPFKTSKDDRDYRNNQFRSPPMIGRGRLDFGIPSDLLAEAKRTFWENARSGKEGTVDWFENRWPESSQKTFRFFERIEVTNRRLGGRSRGETGKGQDLLSTANTINNQNWSRAGDRRDLISTTRTKRKKFYLGPLAFHDARSKESGGLTFAPAFNAPLQLKTEYGALKLQRG